MKNTESSTAENSPSIVETNHNEGIAEFDSARECLPRILVEQETDEPQTDENLNSQHETEPKSDKVFDLTAEELTHFLSDIIKQHRLKELG